MFNFLIKLIVIIHIHSSFLPGHLSADIFGTEEFCYLVKCPEPFIARSHSSTQMIWNTKLFSNVSKQEHFSRRSVMYEEILDGTMAMRKYFLKCINESLKCCTYS